MLLRSADQPYKVAPSHCLPQGSGQGISEATLAHRIGRGEAWAMSQLDELPTLHCPLQSL